MPRKVNYGAHYDKEDYEDYDGYDEDYNSDHNEDVEETSEAIGLKHEVTTSRLWRCFICNYENDESLTSCDICGVIHISLVKNRNNSAKKLATDRKTSRGFPNYFDKKSTFDTQSSAKRSESSSAFVVEGGKDVETSAKISDSSSSGVCAERNDGMDRDGGSKNTVDMQITNKLSDGLCALMPEVIGDNVKMSNSSLMDRTEEQNLASGLHDVSLNVRSEPSEKVNVKKVIPDLSFKPEKWMLPSGEDTMMQLNLAIVGHVDSGKSTLAGRLLHLLGRISQKEMHKYEKEAKIQGKGSFAYAWALDESAEERERGITMTVAVAYFDSKRYHVVVLDSPGHKDFVPNMITGATQADAAILVIDASVGAFEAGMDNKGQTREHAQLIRSFGVDQVIVVVNKMDAVGYSKDRFNMIRQQLGNFLRSCGFKDSSLFWIPLSAMENQNLVGDPSDMRLSSWYKGPHLLDAIDSLRPPRRDFSRPLLMPICDVIKSSSTGQVSVCGKLEAGAIRSGLKVLVMPSGKVATVRTTECNSQSSAIARAGENVVVSLQGIDGSHVMAGGVLCHPAFPVAVAKRLEIKVLVLDGATPILIGSQLEFYIHHAKEVARVVRILLLLDPKTGKATKKAPRCLLAKQSAVIEVDLQEPVCVEESSGCRALARVFLRSLGRTVAAGIVNKVIRDQEPSPSGL